MQVVSHRLRCGCLLAEAVHSRFSSLSTHSSVAASRQGLLRQRLLQAHDVQFSFDPKVFET